MGEDVLDELVEATRAHVNGVYHRLERRIARVPMSHADYVEVMQLIREEIDRMFAPTPPASSSDEGSG